MSSEARMSQDSASNEIQESVSNAIQELVSNVSEDLETSNEKPESASNEKQESASDEKQESASNEKQESASNEKQESASNEKQESASNEKQESASNEKQESASKEKQESASKEKQKSNSDDIQIEQEFAKNKTKGPQGSTPTPVDSPNVIPLTKEQIEELTRRAVFHSTAIIQYDQFNDPVNYWLGAWGKLVVCSAIRKQAREQGIHAEADIDGLDWETIQQNIYGCSLEKRPGLLSYTTCVRWFETRIRIFEYQFPSYRNYIGLNALDHIMQLYATTMLSVKTKNFPLYQYLQWNNLHEWPPAFPLEIPGSDEKVDLEDLKQILSPCFCTFDLVSKSPELKDVLYKKLIPSGIVTRVSITKCCLEIDENSRASVSTSASVSRAESPSISPVRKLDGAVVKMPEIFSRIMEQGTGRAHMIVKINPAGDDGAFKVQNVVIDHSGGKGSSSPMSSTRCALENAKRKLDKGEPGGEVSTVLCPPKRIKLNSGESTRAFLLSLLWKFKNGGGIVGEVSKFMSKMSAKHRTRCEFTLDNIERRIVRGEIQDLHTMFYHCRCLISMYLISRNQCDIPPRLVEYMKTFIHASIFQKNAAAASSK